MPTLKTNDSYKPIGLVVWTLDEVIAEFKDCGFTPAAARSILSRYPWRKYKEASLWKLANRIIREERLYRHYTAEDDFEENELCPTS